MDTQKPLLIELFNKQIRYVVPVFQRHYVWTEEYQWKPLWEDIQNKISERVNHQKIHSHYTGSIVLNQERVLTDTLSTYCVIDGQQRLTTFQLFLVAFREVCRTHIEKNEVLIKSIEKYIFNEETFGMTDYENQKFKLMPTKFDIDMFNSIASSTYDDFFQHHLQPILDERGIGPKTYRNVAKQRNAIVGAYLYFYDELSAYIESNVHQLEKMELVKIMLISLTQDFQFVEIGLSESDDPQMIFETLNGRGASLTETDLIRNYIFMRADANGEHLNQIYEQYWDEYDDPKADYKWHSSMTRGRFSGTRLQFFLIDYLIIKLMDEIRYDQLFYRYKSFIVNNANFNSSEEELKELHKYSKIFKRLTNPNGTTSFDQLAKRCMVMDTTTIYPLLMAIEADTDIEIHDKIIIYSSLDSFLTRRFICGSTTKNYNNVFLDFLKYIQKEKSGLAFRKYLQSKTADSNIWPDDNIFKEKILVRPIYQEEKGKSKALTNILLELEFYIRSKKQETIQISPDNLTIEHVMPQTWHENWALDGLQISEDDYQLSYQKIWGEEKKDGIYHRIENRKRCIHTLGNLTPLTSPLNSSVSNASYESKKPEIIRQSTLTLNAYFQDINIWDEKTIEQRGLDMYKKMKDIWTYPEVESETNDHKSN